MTGIFQRGFQEFADRVESVPFGRPNKINVTLLNFHKLWDSINSDCC